MTSPALERDDAMLNRLASSFPKHQPLIALAILVVCILIGLFAVENTVKFYLYGIAGLCLGYVLVRGAFGFAGGIKRAYIVGEGSLSTALLTMFTVTTLFTLSWQWAQSAGVLPMDKNNELIGAANIAPVSLAMMIGAFLFGMGAIMAGACASGCLSDAGEGYVRAMIALVTFIIFSVPGEMTRAAMDDHALLGMNLTVHLPQWFGYAGAIIASLIGFFIIYMMVWGYERKRKREGTVERVQTPPELMPIPGDNDGHTDRFFSYRLWHNLFCTRWTFMTSAMMLAFLWIFILVTTHKAWGVTSTFTTWDVALANLFGIHFDADWASSANKAIEGGLLNHGGTVRNLALIIGAAYALLLAGRFRFDLKFNARDAAIYALGGALMGFGARMADGCNIGALFSGLSVGSLSGWVFGVFLVAGATVGLKLFEGRLNIIPPSRHIDLKKSIEHNGIPAHMITDR